MSGIQAKSAGSALVFLLAMCCLTSVRGFGQETAPKPPPEVQALVNEARAATNAGRNEEALQIWQKTVEKARELGDKWSEARAFVAISNVYRLLSQPRKALEYGQKAIDLSRSIGYKTGEADALGNMGLAYRNLSETETALDHFQKALTLYRDLSSPLGEARSLGNIAILYRDNDKYAQAIEYFEQSIALFRKVNNKAGEAETLNGIGRTYHLMGKTLTAEQNYLKALELYRTANNRSGEAQALNNIGTFFRDTGQPEKALEYIERALKIHRERGDAMGQAHALTGLGLTYVNTGKPSQALVCYQEALDLYRKSEFPGGMGTILTNMGGLYRDIGEPFRALVSYQEAIPLSQKGMNPRGEARAQNGIGVVYSRIGQPARAQDHFLKALAGYTAIKHGNGQATVLANLGDTYRELKQLATALQYYQRAIPLCRETKDPVGEGHVLNGIATIYAGMNRPTEAQVLFEKALNLVHTAGHKGGEAEMLSNLGAFYRGIGKQAKAIQYYTRALLLFRESGNIYSAARTLDGIALANRALGRPDAAEAHSAQAVALLETARTRFGGFSEAKTTFLASRLPIYYGYLNILLERGKTEKAFEIAEMTKARALLDLLASGRVDISSALTEEERKQESELYQRANFLNAQMMWEGVENEDGAKQRFAALQEQLRVTENQLQTLTDALYARHPSLAEKRVAKTLTVKDVANFLPDGTALLEYLQVAFNKVILFVVTTKQGKAQVTAHPILIAGDVLNKRCSTFRSACTDPHKSYQSEARGLYKLLIAPIEKRLTGKKHLVICSDGPLWDVPFQALLDRNDRPLWERYELVSAYSATAVRATLTTRETNRPTNLGSVLAMANPKFGEKTRFGVLDTQFRERPFDTPSRPFDTPSRPFDTPSRSMASLTSGGNIVSLPGTQREADALKRTFPDAAIFTGNMAQEAVVKAEAGKYRFLHFGTHGFLNDASPLLSSIVMAQPEPESSEDGFLTAREIFDLNLNAEMVVLSACNTGRGQTRTGEGVIGLTWALFVAGCPTHIVSQWSINDSTTARLMTDFYANLKDGKGKAQALRKAALTLRQNKAYTHPYYWSPFFLMGDWR